MSFAVEWTDEALDGLAAAWNAAGDQAAVTAASYRIEEALRADPSGVGETREADDRIVIDRPLAAVYRVLVGQRLVVVSSVRLTRRARS